MKILIVHNYYRSTAPSGENNVVNDEITALRDQGISVDTYTVESDSLSNSLAKKITTYFTIPWNIQELKKFQNYINVTKPDIIHFHNTFPLLSLSLLNADTNAKLVMTLHNYRIFCPAGTPFLHGSPCTRCLDRKSTFPAFVNKCYRDSRLLTTPLIISSEIQRYQQMLQTKLDKILVFSNFQKEIISHQGICEDKLEVKNNFLMERSHATVSTSRKKEFLYAGRLSTEKGILTLLDVWKNKELPVLNIVGDGPLHKNVQQHASQYKNIKYHGRLSRSELHQKMRENDALIFPSIWFEGMPLVLLEAMSHGLPIIGSDLGAIPEVCGDDCALYFDPGNPNSLLNSVLQFQKDEENVERMRLASRQRYEAKYTKEIVIKNQIRFYEGLLR